MKKKKRTKLQFTRYIESDILPKLSKRELEVFRLMVDGKRSKDIADDLGLSVFTITNFKKSATKKLDMSAFRIAILIAQYDILVEFTGGATTVKKRPTRGNR